MNDTGLTFDNAPTGRLRVARRSRSARLGGGLYACAAMLAVVAHGSASAQMVILDPRMLQSGSGGMDSSGSSSVLGQEDFNTSRSSGSSATQTPAFKVGNITPPKDAETLPETPTRAAVVKQAEPGEFETYVRSATGRTIRRFGSSLMIPETRDFNVAANAIVPGDYPIDIGDVVSINTAGSIEGSADFTVDRNGEIFLPQVGRVRLTGVRNRDLHDRVADAIGLKYRGFEVTASIKRLHGIRVYVTGFANSPGAYNLNSLSTLVNAVLAAGGPTGGGSFRSIKLYRNGREVRNFDLYEFLRRGSNANDAILQNEDVLFIPPVGRQVALIGSVNDEAIYEAAPGETLQNLLAFAGGTNQMADSTRAIVYSLDAKNTVGSRQVALRDISSDVIKGGDIVQVLSEGSLIHPMDRQSVVVRLEGEVNKPGNYFVKPGTPLGQVLEMAGGLTSRAYVYGTKLTRESVRIQQRASYLEALDQLEATLATAPLRVDNLVSTADRDGQLRAARELLSKARQVEPDGRLVLELPFNDTALPADLALENNDRIFVPPRIDTIGVFGAVYHPSAFLIGGRSLKVSDFVERSGGLQRSADRQGIFIVRANGDVLTHKRGALNARVQPGDVVFVPVKIQTASFWTKLKDFTQVMFQFGLSAAAIAAIQ